jgi:hypothetical protein
MRLKLLALCAAASSVQTRDTCGHITFPVIHIIQSNTSTFNTLVLACQDFPRQQPNQQRVTRSSVSFSVRQSGLSIGCQITSLLFIIRGRSQRWWNQRHFLDRLLTIQMRQSCHTTRGHNGIVPLSMHLQEGKRTTTLSESLEMTMDGGCLTAELHSANRSVAGRLCG